LIDLIEKFITDDDRVLISDITNNDFELLIKSVDDWSIFNNNSKHIATDYDILGMHLLRCVLSERILEYKRNMMGSLNYPEYEEFIENGVVAISDFNHRYNYDKFDKLMKHITAINRHYSLVGWAVRNDEKVEYDLQYTMHVDTFHPAFKSFGYVNDVMVETGPFSYVKGSHRNTKSKLNLLYKLSVKRSNAILYEGLTRDKNIERWNDSFRLDTKEDYCIDSVEINKYLQRYGLPNESLVEGKSNTYIITDTSGFHRKYPAEVGNVRISSRLVLDRPNPFLI